ncbi:metallophosphoesterase [Flavobacterium sp. NRK F10]|uniref:metallophosphoesterase n=1 Tax=Flavobacterium sp. NRK F10 TaxID=2954931 RepID=UPI00209129B0|nr:metallophosphoesterase [Flavobacterium sp. NRK F10]MCO6175356.1 metallophosphoesterase [Flavobacterium sp. NRK F10]
MKIIAFSNNKTFLKHVFCVLTSCFLLSSCATMGVSEGKNVKNYDFSLSEDTLTVAHTFFLIGDAGNADEPEGAITLHLLKNQLETASKNSTLIFLGDNIYPKGLPDKKDKARALAEEKLQRQLDITQNFKGKTIFIPGNHDWYSGLEGLHDEAKMVQRYFDSKKAFLPKDGCPIATVSVTDNLALIVVDSEWYLEDWNQHPKMNDDCEIKNREEFFDELHSQINKNQNKTIILAIHHPLFSNGAHGGQYSFRKHFFPISNAIPLPVIGSFINLLRKTTGASPQDLQNKQYAAFIKRLKPMIQNLDNIIVVSGHDHNLQYIEKEGIKQIISGAGSKKEAAKATGKDDFTYGGNGFAIMKVYQDGTVINRFYGTDNADLQELIALKIMEPNSKDETAFTDSNPLPPTVSASIYPKEWTEKSKFYSFLWGHHFREYYGLAVEAPVASLDTLYGGLETDIAGGGHQSMSLRLKDTTTGKEYVMRALQKSATRFLQTVAFKDQNVEQEFKNTITERFIFDFYTTAHPFTPFIIGDLADAVGVFHTNPRLFYIPKQKALKQYNETYGNTLYLVEERPTEEHRDEKSFGKPDDIISTTDVLEKIRKDEKYQVDESSFIRARLFDMLIGDWDRHADQWRWSVYKTEDQVLFKPIPRDRDQAFVKVDGNLLSLILKIPAARHISDFKSRFPDEKWFNFAGHNLDIAFIRKADAEDWKKEAQFIADHLTDKVIDSTFEQLPKEINHDGTTQEIIAKLKLRRDKLAAYAEKYYHFLHKRIILTGTDKKDEFIIERLPNEQTKVTINRIKKTGIEKEFSRTYSASETCEIWIYGLDDDDIFKVSGTEKHPIKIRLIGGQNNDTYDIENGKKVVLYDYRSKNNTLLNSGNATVHFKDDYDLNEYHYKKTSKYSAFMGLPSIGYNPDDGIKLGVGLSYTYQGFKTDPFTSKHSFKGNYYFATEGFELFYNSIFTQLLGNWNVEINARYTTPNFSINYFGYGNETKNFDDIFGMNYNRVKIQTFKIAPSFKRIERTGNEISFTPFVENIEVEGITDRFINVSTEINPRVFEYQQFAGAGFKYAFENYDSKANPGLGITFAFSTEWKTNLSDIKRNFTYLESHLGFSHKLTADKKVVLATLLKIKKIFNNTYEFYQGATLGGDYDLRGFRNQRFLGDAAYFQSSDLRWNIGHIKSIVPMQYGILAGYDYGRVWLDGEDSDKWHQSLGGGVWLSGLDAVTARLTFFNSEDGNRIAFGLGFGF